MHGRSKASCQSFLSQTEYQCPIQKVAPGPLDLKDANDFSLWKRSRSTDCSFKLAWLSHQSVPLSFPILRSPSISEDRVEQMDLSVASLILCGLKVRSGMLTPVLDIKLLCLRMHMILEGLSLTKIHFPRRVCVFVWDGWHETGRGNSTP